MRRPLPFPTRFIAAHRGSVSAAGITCRENTLDAFNAAIAAGADAIELDVRRLADGELVVFHDAGAGERRLRTLTRAALDDVVTDRHVPSLRECAEALRGRVPLDVELKDLDVEADALEVFRHAGWTPREFVVTSFDAGTLERVRRAWPDLAIGLLTDDDFGAAVARAAAIETDFLAPHHSTINLDAVSERSVAGLPLVAWTVNDPSRLRALLSHPAIAGVITDAVAVARDARSAGSHNRT
jgi:glycerophosphoryl diester phosphodiesterase